METNFDKYETKQSKVIFPDTLNDHDTLFGGKAMQWMDEVAYITAIRATRKKMVTVSVDKFKFLSPIQSSSIIDITAHITKKTNVKLEIKTEIFVENMFSESRTKAIEALFTFAAVNDANHPIRIK